MHVSSNLHYAPIFSFCILSLSYCSVIFTPSPSTCMHKVSYSQKHGIISFGWKSTNSWLLCHSFQLKIFPFLKLRNFLLPLFFNVIPSMDAKTNWFIIIQILSKRQRILPKFYSTHHKTKQVGRVSVLWTEKVKKVLQ